MSEEREDERRREKLEGGEFRHSWSRSRAWGDMGEINGEVEGDRDVEGRGRLWKRARSRDRDLDE